MIQQSSSPTAIKTLLFGSTHPTTNKKPCYGKVDPTRSQGWNEDAQYAEANHTKEDPDITVALALHGTIEPETIRR